jgi:hypothetical protein
MSDDREFLRATSDWLEAGSDRTPPRAIDAVLLAVRTTRQDRPLPVPWSTPKMPSIVRVLIAAAAVVAISLVVINLRPYGSNVGVAPTIVPTPTPTPTPTPVALEAATDGPSATLTPGRRYSTVDPFPVRMTFEAPSGWTGSIGGPYAVWLKPVNADTPLGFELSPQLFKDPCNKDLGTMSPLPTTTDAIITALSGQPGVVATAPASTTIGGRPATKVTISGPDRVDTCTDGGFSYWQLPLGATEEVGAGMTATLYFVENGEQPLVIVTDSMDGIGTPNLAQTIQQVLDSIQFDQGG